MQFSRIAFSALLARLLGPENFGIIGQATIYLAFASVFLDIGLASALIQRKRIDRDLIGTATSLNMIAVAILVGATQLGAGAWAGFFNTPELASVLRVLSIDFVLIGFAVVPSALPDPSTQLPDAGRRRGDEHPGQRRRRGHRSSRSAPTTGPSSCRR